MFRNISILFIAGIIMLNSSAIALASTTKQQDVYYQAIHSHIQHRCSMGLEWSDWIADSILYYSAQYRVDPLLVTALFDQESGFNMNARSSTGAIGIAQLQPTTAAAIGFDPTDPAQNIEGGVKYLAMQLSRFSQSGDWAATYAVAAYNAGPEAVAKYQGIPPYAETQNHVNRVADIYRQLLRAIG